MAVAQAAGICGIVPVALESAGLPLPAQQAEIGTDPDIAPGIFPDRSHTGKTEGGGIIGPGRE